MNYGRPVVKRKRQKTLRQANKNVPRLMTPIFGFPLHSIIFVQNKKPKKQNNNNNNILHGYVSVLAAVVIMRNQKGNIRQNKTKIKRSKFDFPNRSLIGIMRRQTSKKVQMLNCFESFPG
jgi:hypothetical protein